MFCLRYANSGQTLKGVIAKRDQGCSFGFIRITEPEDAKALGDIYFQIRRNYLERYEAFVVKGVRVSFNVDIRFEPGDPYRLRKVDSKYRMAGYSVLKDMAAYSVLEEL